MKSFIAGTVSLVVTVVIAGLGLMISATLFGSEVATLGGNTVVLGICIVALVAGTFTYKRLVR